MPLFGRNQNTNNTAGANLLHKSDPASGNATGHHGHTGPGPVLGAAAGGAAGHTAGHTATGALLGGAAGHHHAATHPDTVPPAANVTAPGATTTVDGATIPAGPGVGHGVSTKGASEHAFVGKLEHAVGTVLCSSTLRAKGLQKEREAQAIRVQAAELSAAERLESEAAVRRERAVAHGAHPDHLGPSGGTTTGAGMTGSGGNTAGTGVGPGSGMPGVGAGYHTQQAGTTYPPNSNSNSSYPPHHVGEPNASSTHPNLGAGNPNVGGAPYAGDYNTYPPTAEAPTGTGTTNAYAGGAPTANAGPMNAAGGGMHGLR